jgi:hypothetical protein
MCVDVIFQARRERNCEGQAFRVGIMRTAISCFALRSINITNPPPGGCAMNLKAPLGGNAKGRKLGMLAHASARIQHIGDRSGESRCSEEP